jgi:hypothetical protein
MFPDAETAPVGGAEPHPSGRKLKQKFTADEDDVIRSMVADQGPKRWRSIAEQLGGRTARQCRERWINYLSPDVSRAPWTPGEEMALRNRVIEHGQQWSRIARFFEGRTDVSIKNHYLKMMRMDRKIERKRQRTLPTATPAPAAEEEDLKGGAFFLDDGQEIGRDDWQYDSFGYIQFDLPDICK